MAGVRLGPQPDGLTVDLYAGCDWWSELDLTEDDGVTPVNFDPGESLVLRLAGTDHAATINANTARWDLTDTQVDTILDTGQSDAAVLLVVGAVRIPWFVGVIGRHR